ncbi:MAG: hypothetical protein QXF35_01315 [Candidatus Bilamarchaeaceae archaeon]
MKKIIILLLLILLAYAANPSQKFQKPLLIETGATAIIFSTLILTLLYMIGHGFNIQTLVMSSKDELYHLIISIILLGSFVLISLSLDSFIGGNGLWWDASSKIEKVSLGFRVILSGIHSFENVAIEGTETLSCQFFSASLTMSPCGGYSALTPPANTANSILSMVLVSYYVIQNLLLLGVGPGINIIFPLGIFFYSFKFTRPAGSVLIAIAFSLYVLLPLMIIVVEGIYDKYTQNITISSKAPEAKVIGCTADDRISTSENNALETYKNMKKFLEYHMEVVLIKGLIFPIVYILSLAAGIRGIAAVAGIEVDVSAISRLM